jgi:nucleotide-binding universal stress UspA family protein
VTDPDRLLARPLLAVANAPDARVSARALAPYVGTPERVVVVSVVEKAGGAPDKAPMEEVEAEAERAFDAVRDVLGPVETDLRYGVDVVETIIEAGREHDATAIVFTPRSGGRLVRLLTGDVALSLVTEADRPVVALPDPDREGTADRYRVEEGSQEAAGDAHTDGDAASEADVDESVEADVDE